MGQYFDLHRHDETSFFDGFGKPKELAKIAKSLGYDALGISNHGNITGLVQHWMACEEQDIKPILGCEVYFQPKYNKEQPERKTYHLCLFAKDLTGYRNLCHIMTEANREQFYYKAIVDFRLLQKHKEGIICTTACVASATSQAILHGNNKTAEKLLEKLKDIFGEDLYIEIQPYKIDKEGTQEKANRELMKFGKKLGIPCILTSDSHFGQKEDFDTYCKMHEIGKTTLDVKHTYSERYMPAEQDIVKRFVKMHTEDLNGKAKAFAKEMLGNMQRLKDSVEDDILSQCELTLPKIETKGAEDSHTILKRLVKQGLQNKGKWNKQYRKRCLEELDVIHYHGFDDYFLIVQDYVNWARKHDIEVGPGRGSACNCLVAYAIGITDVDSILYDLDFSRFMRKDKKKMPKQYWASLVNIA